jgi:cold shock CspA family protein
MALARIKSFSREQGFGYIDHPEHGDLLFDFEACDFEPEEGDEVEVVELGKRFDGSPKAKKVVCPAKPPKR